MLTLKSYQEDKGRGDEVISPLTKRHLKGKELSFQAGSLKIEEKGEEKFATPR